MRDLLEQAAERSSRYLEGIRSRPVFPSPEAVSRLEEFAEALPEHPCDPEAVLARLDELGSPATVASAGPRYFGFVIGGSLPVALAANWLAGAWDQNAAFVASSPVAARLEEVALGWLRSLLGLPAGAGGGFVTGATAGNLAGLAAARHALLERQGWDVEAHGLFGAPPLRVVVGDEVHASLLKALSLLGLGRERVVRVPVDGQGRMRAESLPRLGPDTLVCVQAGNVNTGAIDPIGAVCAAARAAGAWVHVDGAFGMWAAAAPSRSHLAAGVGEADSWALDAHKWLNVPYDSGLVFCRDAEHLRAAMRTSASYLPQGAEREPGQFVPEMSRRARGVEVWAVLRSLGRSGVAELIERNCRQARRLAEGLRREGFEVLNEVTLNQVLVSFGTDETTREVVRGVQEDGTCWCGGTVWRGRAAMRISVSSWATRDEDVERSLEAIIGVARRSLR